MEEKKGPDAMEERSLMRCFKNVKRPDLTTVISRETLKGPISKMTALHLRNKAEWFSSQKDELSRGYSFRNDYMCLLALSCYLVIKVPKNLKHLLTYKQEPTCRARWLTTASAYLRLLIFDVCQLDDIQRSKLVKLASDIISV